MEPLYASLVGIQLVLRRTVILYILLNSNFLILCFIGYTIIDKPSLSSYPYQNCRITIWVFLITTTWVKESFFLKIDKHLTVFKHLKINFYINSLYMSLTHSHSNVSAALLFNLSVPFHHKQTVYRKPCNQILLSSFPNLTGTPNLELIQLDRAGIPTIPEDICHLAPKVKTL